MLDKMTLRGLIVSKYGSVAKFAAAIGWKPGKAGRIARGESDLTVEEAKTIAKQLDVDTPEAIVQLFFK